jgi:hypothetical protein
MRIIVTKLTDDYHAHLDGRLDVYGVGKTQSEAIGDMVNSYPDAFNVEIQGMRR